ncbi:Ras-related protein Rab-32 [Eumeta japonica]|uniref:Ras-related protein Rab-32 n=1 Tax=Eumeta variegata TaxID=151549 RepID=A0A4C1TGR5_EUMVA|nr:Ras-related protein Rab-32 [Eumeta japonica]
MAPFLGVGPELPRQYNEYGDHRFVLRWSLSLRSTTSAPSGERREHLYKILVIGELGTGKTSIIKRYVHQFFSQHYRATIGVDFALKVLNWDANTIIRLQLWDIAARHCNYRSLLKLRHMTAPIYPPEDLATDKLRSVKDNGELAYIILQYNEELCRCEVSHETVAMAENKCAGKKKKGSEGIESAHCIIRHTVSIPISARADLPFELGGGHIVEVQSGQALIRLLRQTRTKTQPGGVMTLRIRP